MIKIVNRAMIQLILSVAFLIPVTVDAATYYVATSGNDAAGCTTAQNIGTPKRTISSAIGCLKAGDTLYIRAGTYVENILIPDTLVGTVGQPVTIAGYPGDGRPVIRAPSSMTTSLPVFMVPWRASRTPYHLILQGFEIDAFDVANHQNSCMLLDGQTVTVDNVIMRNCGRDGVQMFSRFITVRNSQFINCGRDQPPQDNDTKGVGFYMSIDDSTDLANTIAGDNLFENNIVDGCRGGGGVIHYRKTDNNIVRGNIFRNFGLNSPWPLPPGRPGFVQYGTGVTIGGAGILGSPGPQNNQIYNNIIYKGHGVSNMGQCFNLWGTGSGNDIFNNTCHNVDIGVIVLCGSVNDAALRNNIFSAVSTQYEVCGSWPSAKTNNLYNPDVSATFVNAAAGDFSLKSSSITAGATITAVQTVSRPSAPVNLNVSK